MNEMNSPDLNPEELATLLDERLGDISSESSQSIDPRIEVAIRLANAKHPQMSDQMLSRVQAKVIKANRQQLKSRRILRPQYAIAGRWAAAFAIVMIFFSATALPALANSVPGEFWYPVKRTLENVEVSIASSSTARANVYLTQAERRLGEGQVLLQRQAFDAQLLLDARNSLANFEQLTPQVDATLSNGASRAAWVTESMALLLEEAEQQQIVSGDEVIALLPTGIPSQNNVSSPSSTPTIEPSATAVPTISPTSMIAVTPSITPTGTDVLPTPSPTVEYTETETSVVVPTLTQKPANTETSTPFITATATSQAVLATMYAIENANVRSQPSRDQSVIVILQQGTAIVVIGEDDSGKWWHVKLSDGRLGWIAKFLLSTNKVATSAGNNGSTGNNGSAGNDGNGNFNCDHPGNYCNAPGQIKTPPGQSGNVPTPHGPPDNPGGGNSPNNPPSNPGNGHKP